MHNHALWPDRMHLKLRPHCTGRYEKDFVSLAHSGGIRLPSQFKLSRTFQKSATRTLRPTRCATLVPAFH